MKLKTFGKLFLDPDARKPRWIISDLVPHVAIAFKRLFPKVDPYATNIELSDTDEVRTDLLWFMSRYALETKWMARLEEGAARLEGKAAERDVILNPDWAPPASVGWKPGKEPYLYQKQAASIAIANGGLMLGDEVGLGKTISAIATLMGGAPLPAAIVVQAHLAIQWRKRIEEFTSLTVHIISGTKPYRLPPAEIYIYRYTNIGGWVDWLKNGFMKSVIYDEIQELRRGTETDKGRASSILSGKAEFRMGLTATPVYNYGNEMYEVMSFVKPGLLGTHEEFYREWCQSGRIVKDPDALGSYLRETGWFLRRAEDDPTVDQAMPPPNVMKCRVDWDDGAAADEAELMRKLAQSVMTGSFSESGKASLELDARLRKMTGMAKARSVASYVRMLLRGGSQRVVLAAWHRDVYTIWNKLLADFEPVMYTGSESAAAKNFAIDQFTQGRSRVMLISLRSGAGIDGLQHNCQDLVIGEFDWSPKVHHQMIGRLRRAGQKKQVNVHYLYTDDGADPVMIETLGLKEDQSRGINDPGQSHRPVENDESRIKRLAKFVLEGNLPAPEPCALCEQPSTGHAEYILPISEAMTVPAGPERDAYYGPDNQWYLCREHLCAVRNAPEERMRA